MKTRFYLARHGQTVWNTQQRIQGIADSELTLIGQQQMRQLAKQVKPLNIDLIAASKLGRAQASQAICQATLKLPRLAITQLQERDFGHWQGLTINTLKQQPLFNLIFNQVSFVTPPKGESANQCKERGERALTQLALQQPNKSILVIVHGEWLRCLLSQFQDDSAENCGKNAYQLFHNGCLMALEFDHQSQSFALLAPPEVTAIADLTDD